VLLRVDRDRHGRLGRQVRRGGLRDSGDGHLPDEIAVGIVESRIARQREVIADRRRVARRRLAPERVMVRQQNSNYPPDRCRNLGPPRVQGKVRVRSHCPAPWATTKLSTLLAMCNQKGADLFESASVKISN
jgi:hypothetical protein